ncbi:MAG: tetratricopeptide repeat protein [Planctomycetota bacterium]|nr:tetratricopeptide repeat protein [Planctomycetota bacterium]
MSNSTPPLGTSLPRHVLAFHRDTTSSSRQFFVDTTRLYRQRRITMRPSSRNVILIAVSWWLIACVVGCGGKPGPKSLLDEAQQAFNKADYQLADTKFSEALRLGDSSDRDGRLLVFRAYQGRANSRLALNQFEDALTDFDEAIKLSKAIDSDLPGLFDFGNLRSGREVALKGRTLVANGQSPPSASDAQGKPPLGLGVPRSDPFQGMQVPDRIQTLLARVGEELQKEEFDAAIATMTEAIQVAPEGLGPVVGNLYAIRAGGHLRKGDKDAALTDCEMAIRCGCKMASAYFNRACIIAEKGKYQTAISDFDQAIQLDSKHAKTYHYRGLVQAKLGNRDAADRDFAKAKELDPNVEKASMLHLN